VHDAAREWAAQSLPARTPARDAVPARVRVAHAEPKVALRDFTDEEVKRIERVQGIVREAALEHGVPPSVVNGIIWVESKFLPEARGRRGPRGLMQLMPRTAREIARALGRRYAPHDPEFNIHAGTYYFARMMERFGNDPTLALAAYNVGPAVVKRWLEGNEPFSDTIGRYVDRVLDAADAFRRRGY
jgi:soluble lytic murein transglycosylase-like protein